MLNPNSAIQKASRWAPFVFIASGIIFYLSFISPSLSARANPQLTEKNCTINHYDEIAKVDYVYDGDTIRLTDGRKLRLIGINTPEHGKDGKTDEPFYNQAKIQLKQIIEKSHGQLKLLYGNEKHDHYQRMLAHIFTAEGSNISATLLSRGLGYSIAIPPNLRFLQCYQQAEKSAKMSKQGLWNHPFGQPLDVAMLDKSVLGFHQIIGTVQRVGESRSSLWLNLSKTFALRIPKKDLHYFSDYPPATLIGEHIIARGWIYRQNKREQRMSIQHPASIQRLNAD